MSENDSNKRGRILTPSRAIAATLAVALMAFCAWAMVQYVQGNNPLAFAGSTSGAFQTVDEADLSTSGVTTDATTSTDQDASATVSDTTTTQTDASPGSGAVATEADVASSSTDGSDSSSTTPADDSSVSADTSRKASTISVSVAVDGSAAGAGSGSATVTLDAGASVYDALVATGASVNARGSVYGTYVSAINGLAEREHGASSGWVYSVNGTEPNTACSNYVLVDGDSVTWTYTAVE